MTEIPNNPKLDSEYLEILKKKVDSNRANSAEYKILDDNISSLIGQNNSIIKILNASGFESYDEYINERKKNISERTPEVEGTILGKILGTISAFGKIFTNQI
jgi:hypothetical protein